MEYGGRNIVNNNILNREILNASISVGIKKNDQRVYQTLQIIKLVNDSH